MLLSWKPRSNPFMQILSVLTSLLYHPWPQHETVSLSNKEKNRINL
uniref:Uncharacterized protein n=1 Tax=Arundo donax TaxID=35708 RepID=A0A0A9FFJ3_ARUDO